MRDERRELVQLAVEELIKRDGQLPSSADVASEIGLSRDAHTVRRDWDWLHEQGKLPERPNQKLPRRGGRNFGSEGGTLFLEAEVLLRRVIAEIANSSPEYRVKAQEFWVTHLNAVTALAEEAMTAAMGTTVDDLIDRINEKGR